MAESKAEITKIFNEYRTRIDDTFSADMEFRWVLDNIDKHIASEKPDAYLVKGDVSYGIEHFQISQYIVKKGQDTSRIAKGSQAKREKMKSDRDFSLQPSIENLIVAMERNLKVHSNSFNSYKSNILNLTNCNNEYKLVIFVEDSTDSGYIVKRRDTKAINPLNLRQLAEKVLQYKNDIWAIIYSYGNEMERVITGCTVKELEDRSNRNQLFNADDYAPFEVKRDVHISSKDENQDKNTITIKLYNYL